MRCATWIASLVLLLPLFAGCSTLGQQTGGAAIPATERRDSGGLLLKTGALQLGPGLGQNAYSWQGDPHPAFFR